MSMKAGRLYIDFETRSEAKLTDVGAYRYAVDPTTEIMCTSFAWNDGSVKTIVPDALGYSNFQPLHWALHEICEGRGKLVAHNAFFERSMWQKMDLLHPFYILDDPSFWIDTMAKCYMHSLPGSLFMALNALEAPEGKDMEGHRIMMKMSKPRKPTKKDKRKWHCDPEDLEILYNYCEKDVEVERWLDNQLADLPPREQEVWIEDQRINDRGINIDLTMAYKAVDLNTIQVERANEEIEQVTKGAVTKVTQIARIKEYILGHGVRTPGLDVLTINELLANPVVTDHVKKVLTLRKDNGKGSISKYTALLNAEWHGTVRGILNYHAGHTGRWGGRQFQPHNLPRGTIKDIDTARWYFQNFGADDLKEWYPQLQPLLSSLIRTVVKARPGKELAYADYSAIEARFLAWLAGDTRTCDKFEAGVDLYIEMASVIYNIKEKDVTNDMRQVGKTAILGCGYGMGPDRFHSQVYDMTGIDLDLQAARLQEGREIPMDEFIVNLQPSQDREAVRIVKAYRRRFKRIVQYWYAMDGAVRNAILAPGKIYRCGKVSVKVSGKFLRIRLPSGRLLYFYKPRLDEDNTIRYWGVNSTTKQWCELRTYGGKIVENITQAGARDLLAEAILNLRNTKYEVAFHVHDEITSEVNAGEADLEEYYKLLTDMPAWADGCPISADGWIGEYYHK